jgi:hypothetical protein
MSEICTTGLENMAIEFGSGNLRGRHNLGDVSVNGKITFIRISECVTL